MHLRSQVNQLCFSFRGLKGPLSPGREKRAGKCEIFLHNLKICTQLCKCEIFLHSFEDQTDSDYSAGTDSDRDSELELDYTQCKFSR